MKRNLFLTSVLIAIFSFALNAQTIVDFEDLSVPAEGYYNGSTDYSGSGNTETFFYSNNGVNFHVRYTNTGTYDYWDAFAYSNQTDLSTADWTNYSAYADPAGGADNSSNYVIAYLYQSDTVVFDNLIQIDSVKITNSVWAHQYINDNYTSGDSLVLHIWGMDAQGTKTDTIDFYLADFTGGNSVNIDNWTNVDLSSLGNVKYLWFMLTSSDNYTPFYFCMDDLTYSDISGINNIKNSDMNIYPNPANDFINIDNIENSKIIISDISGKTVLTKTNCNKNEKINISNLIQGIYFVKSINGSKTITKKFIKK